MCHTLLYDSIYAFQGKTHTLKCILGCEGNAETVSSYQKEVFLFSCLFFAFVFVLNGSNLLLLTPKSLLVLVDNCCVKILVSLSEFDFHVLFGRKLRFGLEIVYSKYDQKSQKNIW